MRIRPITYS